MHIHKNISPYSISSTSSIRVALDRLGAEKTKVLFVLDGEGKIVSSFSDGDFRRWIQRTNDIDLDIPVTESANTTFVFANELDSRQHISSILSDRITVLPILNSDKQLHAIATKSHPQFTINDFTISQESGAFIIAEIGNNHNGSVVMAKKLIDEAKLAGAHCAKFQMRDMETLYKNPGVVDDASEDLGSQYVLDLLSRFQLNDKEFEEVFKYCHESGLAVLCTPFDKISAIKLYRMGVEAFKVASADLTNHDLIEYIAQFNKPIIISTGMATESEILETIDLLNQLTASYILLHCNSTYPAPFKDINLNYLNRLKEIGNGLVGYSGHERGVDIAIAAVAMGARVIEKHFTLDKTMEGNDHKVSLLPREMKKMIEGISNVESALGTSGPRTLSQGETMNREVLAKSLISTRDIGIGETITAEMLDIKSPGKGVQPSMEKYLVGTTAKRIIRKGDFFYKSDIDQGVHVQARDYKFNIPFGIPVRYHDVTTLAQKSNFDFIEFHLSYKDLALQIGDFFNEKHEMDFVVHAPELFAGDHTLDLCSSDENYRKHSLREMQKVINVTRDLKRYFPKTEKPCIVTNVGGFTSSGFITKEEKIKLYSILETSLSELDREGVEIIPQTMPPFPWHFGGQQYHNLFVSAEDIKSFCERNNMRICLDISHSALACNYYDWDLYNFTEEVAELSAHHHIADAYGDDGEGLAIGEGDIDFRRIFEILEQNCLKSTWLPEIWQGHKNEGEGFWRALETLETIV